MRLHIAPRRGKAREGRHQRAQAARTASPEPRRPGCQHALRAMDAIRSAQHELEAAFSGYDTTSPDDPGRKTASNLGATRAHTAAAQLAIQCAAREVLALVQVDPENPAIPVLTETVKAALSALKTLCEDPAEPEDRAA